MEVPKVEIFDKLVVESLDLSLNEIKIQAKHQELIT